MGLFSWDVFEYIVISDNAVHLHEQMEQGEYSMWNRHGSSLVATIHLWLGALRKTTSMFNWLVRSWIHRQQKMETN